MSSLSEPLIPPKPYFLRLPIYAPARGQKLRAGDTPSRPTGRSAAVRAGLRYEKKVKAHLREVLPGIELGVWWRYADGLYSRTCQTDAFFLHHSTGVATIFEIKHHHTSDSWWQLRKLYQPVVRSATPEYVAVNVVEVCRVYDSSVVIPELVIRIDDLGDWVTRPCHEFGVYSWRG